MAPGRVYAIFWSLVGGFTLITTIVGLILILSGFLPAPEDSEPRWNAQQLSKGLVRIANLQILLISVITLGNLYYILFTVYIPVLPFFPDLVNSIINGLGIA